MDLLYTTRTELWTRPVTMPYAVTVWLLQYVRVEDTEF